MEHCASILSSAGLPKNFAGQQWAKAGMTIRSETTLARASPSCRNGRQEAGDISRFDLPISTVAKRLCKRRHATTTHGQSSAPYRTKRPSVAKLAQPWRKPGHATKQMRPPRHRLHPTANQMRQIPSRQTGAFSTICTPLGPCSSRCPSRAESLCSTSAISRPGHRPFV